MRTHVLFLTGLLLLAPMAVIVDFAEATSGRAIACSGPVCLNEALPNPQGYDDDVWPNGEWMEIYNSGSAPVDVLSWTLTNKANKVLTFDLSLIHI